tara:strand:+ start:25 stop:186 length:162 start_codon:yes stop_codon:yes gene_type:complete
MIEQWYQQTIGQLVNEKACIEVENTYLVGCIHTLLQGDCPEELKNQIKEKVFR